MLYPDFFLFGRGVHRHKVAVKYCIYPVEFIIISQT